MTTETAVPTIFTDNWFQDGQVTFDIAKDAEGNDVKRIQARVAKLDYINANGRMLSKGVLGDKVMRVAVSDWGHSSVPSFFGGNTKPVAIADIREDSDGFLHMDAQYPMTLPVAADMYDYLKQMKDYIGFSVTYRATNFSFERTKTDDLYQKINTADFVEVTPDWKPFVASAGTGIQNMDTKAGGDTPNNTHIPQTMPTPPALSDISTDQLIAELNKRGIMLGDVKPFIEYLNDTRGE